MAGTLAGFYDENNEVPYYLWIGGASIVVGLLLAACSPWIRKLMQGVH
jgi:POT family proton-dependent oligopeptide transporter